MNVIDTRGLSCPQPVVMTKKEINRGKGDFSILLDSVVAKENVLRVLERFQLQYKEIEENGEFKINVKRS